LKDFSNRLFYKISPSQENFSQLEYIKGVYPDRTEEVI